MARYVDVFGVIMDLSVEDSAPASRSLLRIVMDASSAAVGPLARVAKDAVAARTPLELGLAASALSLGAWEAYRIGLFGALGSGVGKMTPGLSWLRAQFGDYKIKYSRGAGRRVMESRKEGSEEREMTIPKFQCVVAVKDGSTMTVIGCAVRFEGNLLVGPDHVLGAGLGVPKYVKGSQTWLSLAGYERVSFDADIVAIKLSDKDFSQIGLSVAKISGLESGSILAQIVGPEGRGTVGVLKHDSNMFGGVVYSGTTLSGYSGAAYTRGSFVVGLHHCGGAFNGGYSAQYIANLLRVLQNMRLETGPDYLAAQYKEGKNISWKNTGDPDLIQVRVNGQYSIIETEYMDRAFGVDWRDDPIIRPMKRKGFEVRFEDMESRVVPVDNFSSNASILANTSSGEANSSMNLGASSVVENSQEWEKPECQKLISQFAAMSATQQKLFLKSNGLLYKPLSPSGGQTRTSQP